MSDHAAPAAQLHLNRRSRRDRRSDVETSVLDAAERLLERQPLHELEAKQIIAEAGVSRTAFYMYFSSKFDVVAALLSRSVAEIFDAVQTWVTGEDRPPDERLRASLEAAAGAWAASRGILNGAAENWHADPDLKTLWLSVLDQFILLFTDIVNRDLQSGKAHVTGEVEPLVAALVWSTERIFYLGSSGTDARIPDMATAIDVTYGLWRDSIYR